MQKDDSKLFWSILISVNIVLAGIFVFAGTDKTDYSVNQKKNSHLIGVSYMTMNNEFYKIMSEEINARVDAEGDRVILRDPALDADRQIRQIGEMLDAGADVLVITPVDWESLTSVLQRARKEGVYVVVVDSNVYDEELVDCTITSDNYNAGRIIGEYFLTQCRKAKLVIMTHETAKSGQDRVEGFLDAVEDCAGIQVVSKIECEGQTEIAMPRLQKEISSGLVFDNVFCLNDLAAVGVVAALDESQMLDQVDVYGVDASPDSKALIYEGMMKASAAQFPTEIGSEAADVIYRLLKGEKVSRHVLTPVKLITKENVEEFGIDRWQ